MRHGAIAHRPGGASAAARPPGRPALPKDEHPLPAPFTRRGVARAAAALRAARPGGPDLPARLRRAGVDTRTGSRAAGRGGAFDWRSAAGQSITVLDKFGPANEFYATQMDAFERLTGIKVDYQMARDGDVRLKTLTAFTAGDTSIDVFNSTTVQEGVRYLKAGWYAPLDRYLRDRARRRRTSTRVTSSRRPWRRRRCCRRTSWWACPRTPRPRSCSTTRASSTGTGCPTPAVRPGRGAPGGAAPAPAPARERGLRPVDAPRHAAAIAHWSIFLHDRGGSWFDRDGKVSVSTPLALEATEHYGRLLRRLGPPELQQGAQLNISAGLHHREDRRHPGAAPVRRRCSSTRPRARWRTTWASPASPPARGSAPLVFSWISSISNLSRKREAAWLWVQWHTGKDASLRLGVEAGMPPSRRSAWSTPTSRPGRRTPT